MIEEPAPRKSDAVGPVALALFLSSGSIKSHPFLAWIPTDLTVLLGALLVVCIFGAVIRSRVIPNSVWIALVTGVAMTGGLFPELVRSDGIDKARNFFALTLLAMVAAAVLLREKQQRAVFLRTFAYLGIVVAIIVAVIPARPAEWSNVVMLTGSNTISTSRMILAGVVVIVMEAIVGKRSWRVRFILALLAIGMLFVALGTGSRGPLLALAAGVVLALLFSPAFKGRRGRAAFVILALAGVGISFATRNGVEGLARITALIEGDQDTSSATRAGMWEISWSRIVGLPLGGGWGYFARISNGPDLFGDGRSAYPHNLLLEIALEAGWIPAVLVLGLIIMALITYVASARTAQTLTFFVLFIFSLVNAMVSGDINDNRLLWVLIVAAWTFREPGADLGSPGAASASSHPRNLLSSVAR